MMETIFDSDILALPAFTDLDEISNGLVVGSPNATAMSQNLTDPWTVSLRDLQLDNLFTASERARLLELISFAPEVYVTVSQIRLILIGTESMNHSKTWMRLKMLQMDIQAMLQGSIPLKRTDQEGIDPRIMDKN
jgi:hypothetical protein